MRRIGKERQRDQTLLYPCRLCFHLIGIRSILLCGILQYRLQSVFEAERPNQVEPGLDHSRAALEFKPRVLPRAEVTVPFLPPSPQ